jgi:hypothetical protein
VENYLAATETLDPSEVSCGYGQFMSKGLHIGVAEVEDQCKHVAGSKPRESVWGGVKLG